MTPTQAGHPLPTPKRPCHVCENSGKRLGHMTTHASGNIKKWSWLQLTQKNPLITKKWNTAKFLIELALLVPQTKWSSTWILHSLNLCLPRHTTCLLSALPECLYEQHYIFLEYTSVLPTLFLGLYIPTEQLAYCCHFKYFQLEIMGEKQNVIHIIHCLQYSNPAQLLTVVCFYNMALRPRSVSVPQLSWVTALYSYITYEVEKCPLHARNEQKMAIRSSIQNKTRSKKGSKFL